MEDVPNNNQWWVNKHYWVCASVLWICFFVLCAGAFLVLCQPEKGGLGLLILGGEPIADEVCLKILFLCVSSS